MNTREKFEEMLVNNGLFPDDAKSIMEVAMPEIDKQVENYKFTWDRPASEYPDVIYNVVFLSIKPIALKWIEENRPMAWFRPMFEAQS